MACKNLILEENDFYRALFDTYVEQIRQSGLLLDEDLEILVNHESVGLYHFPKYDPSLKLKASLACLVGCLPFVKKFDSKWIILPPAIFTLSSVFLEIRNNHIKGRQKELVENIVNILKKIISLSSSIKKYMKTRSEVENKSQKDFFKSYNKHVENFLSKIHNNEIKFFDSIMNTLEVFAKFSNNLRDDFNSIKDFKPFNNEPTLDSINSCINLLAQVQDVHVWLTSKMLSYLGIMLLSPNLTVTEEDIKKLLRTIIPNLIKNLNEHYISKRKLFTDLRNSIAKLNEFKSQTRKPHISSKVQNTLLSAVDNISIITEKSSRIFEEIENCDDRFSPELQSALVDLRNHSFAAYESLDLLCRLYGILSSQNVPSGKLKAITKDTEKASDANVITVHHDDDIEAVEEHFELYLEKDFVAKDEPQTYTDDSGAYLSLMLQELRQSLRKHERFIEAKKRRGSTEEEKVEIKEKDLPTFNLKALEENTEPDVKNADKDIPTEFPVELPSLPTNIPPKLPPPPPPPMPEDLKNFNLQFLSQQEDIKQRSKSMFDSIKTLSSQLNMQEEVFGESGDDEED